MFFAVCRASCMLAATRDTIRESNLPDMPFLATSKGAVRMLKGTKWEAAVQPPIRRLPTIVDDLFRPRLHAGTPQAHPRLTSALRPTPARTAAGLTGLALVQGNARSARGRRCEEHTLLFRGAPRQY